MEVITNVQFDEVISKGVVVIDFFANWCGPCKMLAPVLEEVAQELPKVTFAKVDVDQDLSLIHISFFKYAIYLSKCCRPKK